MNNVYSRMLPHRVLSLRLWTRVRVQDGHVSRKRGCLLEPCKNSSATISQLLYAFLLFSFPRQNQCPEKKGHKAEHRTPADGPLNVHALWSLELHDLLFSCKAEHEHPENCRGLGVSTTFFFLVSRCGCNSEFINTVHDVLSI